MYDGTPQYSGSDALRPARARADAVTRPRCGPVAAWPGRRAVGRSPARRGRGRPCPSGRRTRRTGPGNRAGRAGASARSARARHGRRPPARSRGARRCAGSASTSPASSGIGAPVSGSMLGRNSSSTVDAHLLHVGVGAAGAGAAQRSADASADEDAAVRALQAEVGVERPGKLDVRAEADVAVAKPRVADRARRLVEEPGDVERDHWPASRPGPAPRDPPRSSRLARRRRWWMGGGARRACRCRA